MNLRVVPEFSAESASNKLTQQLLDDHFEDIRGQVDVESQHIFGMNYRKRRGDVPLFVIKALTSTGRMVEVTIEQKGPAYCSKSLLKSVRLCR